MPIKLQLHNNLDFYEYDSIKDIPKEFYLQIKVFKCNDCNLDNIDFIANFINLQKLNASNNKIKIIPIVSNIEEIEIYNNELEELPPINNLKKLYAFNNKLKSLPILPNLEIIDVSHNKFLKIILEEKIEKIYISHNRLVKIEIKGTNVEELECNNNLLMDINFIHGLDKLKKFNYDNNQIKIIPVHIKRYLNNNNSGNIYTLQQCTLNKETINKILKIINLFYNIKPEAYNIIKNEIVKYKLISPEAMILLKKYTTNNTIEPTIRLTYLELFICLWDRIIINIKKLNDILINKDCECITCLFKKLTSLIN
jgi:Leucine-rich repeat (LRR) protein